MPSEPIAVASGWGAHLPHPLATAIGSDLLSAGRVSEISRRPLRASALLVENARMAETLATKAYRSLDTDELATITRKARLEAFTWSYCQTLAAATEAERLEEARALGVPVERLDEVAGHVDAPRALILADVLRLFGDRDTSSAEPTEIDLLFDEIMGTTGGFDGTLPG